MQQIEATSVEQLQAIISGIGDGRLFRGQCSIYELADGSPSIRPSFWASGGRSACLSSLRLRWSSYAEFIVYAILGHSDFDGHLSEAILQHYGWKSFFLDASKSPHVAAWFASRVYSESMQVHMVEDCWETPAFLRNRVAKYDPLEGVGNLYVISPDGLKDHDLKVIDLAILSPGSGTARHQVQKAVLIGPFPDRPMPVSAITHHIRAPAPVYCEYAAQANLHTYKDVFPSPDHDPIYKNLLSTPWIKMDIPSSEIDIKAYSRFLEIPDYYDTFQKRLPPEISFYDGFSIHDAFVEHGKPFYDPVFVDIEDVPYFGPGRSDLIKFTETANLISQWETVIFEMDLIAPRPDIDGGKDCSKGLLVHRIDEGAIEISDLTITLVGMQVTSFGAEMGWRYLLEKDGTITRSQSSNDCPCGNELRHQFHLEALRRIEEAMQRYGIKKVSERHFKMNTPNLK